MEHPEDSLLPAGERATAPARAKVHIAKGQGLKVFGLLEERGSIKWAPATETFSDDRGEILNGLFGVIKPNKFTANHLPVLRVIVNLIPTNGLFRMLDGDISFLPSATGWLPLCIAEGEEVYMSQGDMASAFYLFRMLACWHKYMNFNFSVPGELIGQPTGVLYRPTCLALPMGWRSSVGLMQQISREVLLAQGLPAEAELRKRGRLPPWFASSTAASSTDQAWWQVYLDNFMSGEQPQEAAWMKFFRN